MAPPIVSVSGAVATPPALVTLSCCDGVAPMTTAPKGPTPVAPSVAAGTALAVSEAVAEMAPAVAVSVAERLPVAVGANTTSTLHVPAGGSGVARQPSRDSQHLPA